METNYNGLAVIRATLENGVITVLSINHVPPTGVSLLDVDVEHIEKELMWGIKDITDGMDYMPEVLFFFEYTSEAVPSLKVI